MPRRRVRLNLTEAQAAAVFSALLLFNTHCEQDGPETIGADPGEYRAARNAERIVAKALQPSLPGVRP